MKSKQKSEKEEEKTLSKEINKKNGFEKFFFVLSLYMMKRSANQHHLDSHSYFLFFFYIFKRLKLLTKTRGICKCGGMRMLSIVFFWHLMMKIVEKLDLISAVMEKFLKFEGTLCIRSGTKMYENS